MLGMDTKLLLAFITLVEKGSYHNASESLFLKQPALTKQIQTLEKIIGSTLFLRGRHGAKLTTIGKLLYPKALELLASHQDFFTYAKEIQKTNIDKLFVGFGISSFQNVPIWINTFYSRFPNCNISIKQIPSSLQIQMLMEGTLHVGFVRMPVVDSLESKIIYSEELILAIPANIQIDPTKLQYILSIYPLLQMEQNESPCLAKQISLFLKKNNLIANLVAATGDIHSLLALIAGGNGVSFLPAGVKNFLPTGVKLIYPQKNQLTWDIGVTWNPKIKNQLRDEFLKVVIS